MHIYLRNKYEFLIMASIVIPFITIMVLGRHNSNSVDLSLISVLCLLWPLFGIMVLRGFLRNKKALIVAVYLVILITYIVHFLVEKRIIYSMALNTFTSIFIVLLPVIVFATVIRKIYYVLAVLLIFWFSIITYYYNVIPKQFRLGIFLLSFFLALTPIRLLLKYWLKTS
jgi:hypothetical protein